MVEQPRADAASAQMSEIDCARNPWRMKHRLRPSGSAAVFVVFRFLYFTHPVSGLIVNERLQKV